MRFSRSTWSLTTPPSPRRTWASLAEFDPRPPSSRTTPCSATSRGRRTPRSSTSSRPGPSALRVSYHFFGLCRWCSRTVPTVPKDLVYKDSTGINFFCKIRSNTLILPVYWKQLGKPIAKVYFSNCWRISKA